MSLKFGGHSTFALRGLWPKKAYDAVQKNVGIFCDPQAIGLLGMGKNMVESLKFWNEALGLITSSKNGKVKSEPFGEIFLDDDGLDPFLENPATIWIFHYKLTTSSIGGVWYWLFNHCQMTEFTVQQALTEIEHWLETQAIRKPSTNTLKRDLDCCIRCYAPSMRDGHDTESDCPFKELGLLKRAKSSVLLPRDYRPSLSSWVTLGALVDYWKRYHEDSRTLSLEECLYSPQSPGKIFRLNSVAMTEQFALIEQHTKGKFQWSEAAGLQQISYKGDLKNPIGYWEKAYG